MKVSQNIAGLRKLKKFWTILFMLFHVLKRVFFVSDAADNKLELVTNAIAYYSEV